MLNKLSHLGISALSLLIIASCSTSTNINTSNNSLIGNSDYTNYSVSSLIGKFVNAIENDEVLVDEQYYRKNPDQKLVNIAMKQIESGRAPSYLPSLKNDATTEGLFNHKAEIDIYDSYGTQSGFVITGKVFERKNTVSHIGDSILTNLIKNIKTFIQDPIKNVDVNISVGGINKTVKTDSKGLYKVTFEASSLKPGNAPVIAKLLDAKYKAEPTQGEVVIDDLNSNKLAVITDIDDTIKISSVDHKIELIKNIFLGNYATDKAIPGVASMYDSIVKGPQGTGFDCVHYVTGSYIQLDGRLDDFLKYNKFPIGSLDLKIQGQDPSDIVAYKLSRIRPIMKAFPNKRFIMFGDAIQSDPEIYVQLKHEFPGRVAGIYIRNTKNESPYSPRYKEAMLTNSAVDAAKDLFKNGFITQDALDKITADVNKG